MLFPSCRKAETLEGIKKGDTVIVVAPGPKAEWASSMQRFKEQKVRAQDSLSWMERRTDSVLQLKRELR